MDRSKRNCCVVGCVASERSSTGSNTKFYCFPGREWEKSRRQTWINAVNRINPDGTPWLPSANSRICSAHFVGGAKSNNPTHPAYNPSIFPEKYRKKAKTASDISRFQRSVNRTFAKTASEDVSMCLPDSDSVPALSKSVDCQVGVNLTSIDESSFIFESSSDGKNLSTQCNIGANSWRSNPVCDKASGSDEAFEACKGFHGYKSLKGESHLRDLTSTSFAVFHKLLSNMSNRCSVSISNEDSLLLCLMKLKLGVSFSALGIMFGIHRTTASRIFLYTLKALRQLTSKCIFWPSKLAIQNTLPPSFSEHYCNTRVIIDCTEIKTEIPNKISDRVYMYSSYKGAHTFKFLIGVTPNGYISFKSKCYGGRASDAYITNNCGILDLLDDNDIVLADKGFPGVRCEGNKIIVMPPFLHNGRFTYDEVMETKSIASVRIHVERCIGRVKIFKILQNTLPHNLFPHIDDIIHVVCVLANFLPQIIKEKVD